MDLRERYIKNVNRFGSSQGERDKLKLEMAFEKLLNDSTNSVEIEYTTIANIIAENEPNTEKVVINDSRINDKTFFDEKLIFCKNTSNITVGSYLKIKDEWYLVTFEERRPHGAYKEYVARVCTANITVKREWLYSIGEIMPTIKKESCVIPIVVENLTLYSEGVREINYGMLSIVDGKRKISYGTDERFHKFMIIGRRFMLMHETAFHITHIDNFSFKGITTITAMQSVVTPEDNADLNIADYYNLNILDKDISTEQNLSDYKLQLLGVERIKIGSNQLYKASVIDLQGKEVDVALSWEITNIKGSPGDIKCELIDNKTLSIKPLKDLNIIGGQFVVKVSIQDEPQVSIEKNVVITSLLG